MQVQGEEEQTAFDQVVEQARDLTTVYPASTYFELVNKPHRRLTESAYRTSLEQLGISGHTASLQTTLARLVETGVRQEGQIYIFSDFQKNDFSPQFITGFDTTQQVFLVPVVGKEGKNVYVDSLMLDDAFVRVDADLSIKIRVHNGGNVAANNCQVRLFIGERQAAAFQTSVEAGASTATTVQVRLTGRDLQRCRVEIEDFPVTFDNTYYFTLQPAPQIRIAELASDKAATQRLYANEPMFSYTLGKPNSVDYRALTAANLVLIQELPRIETSLRENLQQAVQRGATLVIVPPADATGRQSYNTLFHDLGLGTVQWEPSLTDKPSLRDLASPNLQNPFFREVFARQNRPAVMPKAAPVLHWSRSGIDVLHMRDGEAYLAGFPSGKGKVYLFSAPFDERYSSFTNHALFVPVMYRLAMQSFRNDQQPAYRLNQRTVALAIDGSETAGRAERVFKLTKDSLTFIPVQRIQAGELRFDVPPEMQAPGFYQLSRNGRMVATLAFNFDKRESNLAHYSAQELRAMIGNRSNMRVYDASAGTSVASQYRAERVGTPLWRYCLWGALACLLAEVLLLRFGGRRQTAAQQPIANAA
ncbi:hypothetical protein GCM10011383_40930 [Hymenobacter cavernae]|uniref:Cyclic di-GMP-binding protein n=2 Tax=Hymenobacter cavernae TaxID=2044852 RepID=A0ABQ1UR65_9BACT|nr:hypothetical protein GCM10011383_40930 [Hymenobacter cavernae]